MRKKIETISSKVRLKQSCPVLFNIVLESLAAAMKQDKEIRVIKI
jgi:hypothetical protein